MNDTTRTVLIALGVALLVILLVPLLFMAGMMGTMTSGMGGMMNGGSVWFMGGLALLILGVSIIVIGVGGAPVTEHADRSATRAPSTPQGTEDAPP